MMTAGKVMTVLARLILDGDEMTIIIHNIMMVVLITNSYICSMIRSRTTELLITMLFPDDDVEDYIDDDAEADENVRGAVYDNADDGKDD